MEVRHPIVHENATLPLQAEIMPREGNNPMLENDDLRDTLAGPSQELSQNGGLTRYGDEGEKVINYLDFLGNTG